MITSIAIAAIVLCSFCIQFSASLGISNEWLKYFYYISGSSISVLALITSFLLSKFLSSAKVTASYGSVKLETEAKKTTGSYIDDHIFEIVYALESLARDIGYTVVLEDMDRLGREICIDIFSKLKRINYIINDRKKLNGKHIRFVYAFDDSVFELTKNTKFFDYVMSVTPKLNYNTGGQYFKELILQSLTGNSNQHRQIKTIIENYDDHFWEYIGLVIHDYRILNHIRNDFQLFVNIMRNRKFVPNERWLPFVIYKNVLAEDYCNAFEEKGILELSKDERHKKIDFLCSQNGSNYSELVKILFDYLIDELHLSGIDFQQFTGMPQRIVEIRNESKDYSEIGSILEKKILPDYQRVGKFVSGKNILVIGGGGTIGGEICRQLVTYSIKSLILVEVSENNAYNIQRELMRTLYKSEIELHVEIASTCDEKKINALFDRYQPDVVFHAGMYKNVPLMENNPEEAIKNNVIGTYNLICSAERSKVEKFILISTDKAASLNGIIGLTARFCEILIRSRSNCNTKFAAVRFGNVIDMNGSMVSLMKSQIQHGGPVTVTHPDIIRYILTASEACQLVLQCSSVNYESQIYSLEMGIPVKMVSVAEYMIHVAGLKPYIDIEIAFSGLPRGERLYEELLDYSVLRRMTENSKIFLVESDMNVEKEFVEYTIMKINEELNNRAEREVLIEYINKVISKDKVAV